MIFMKMTNIEGTTQTINLSDCHAESIETKKSDFCLMLLYNVLVHFQKI